MMLRVDKNGITKHFILQLGWTLQKTVTMANKWRHSCIPIGI